MIETDLAFAPVTELAQLVRERKISPVELVRMYLERIDRWDDRLHAYVTVSREAAMQQAKEAEAAVTRGDRLGPLQGMRLAVKDQFLTEGIRTTNGTRTLAAFVPDEDATAVTRLRGAGAILLGKLNMPEGGLLGTRDWPYGQPRNPWNTDHDAGASYPQSRLLLRGGRDPADLGKGEPARDHADRLADGHRQPHDAHRRGWRADPQNDRRSRSEGRLHRSAAGAGLCGRPRWRRARAAHRGHSRALLEWFSR